jgi:hypothetical protein
VPSELKKSQKENSYHLLGPAHHKYFADNTLILPMSCEVSMTTPVSQMRL